MDLIYDLGIAAVFAVLTGIVFEAIKSVYAIRFQIFKKNQFFIYNYCRVLGTIH